MNLWTSRGHQTHLVNAFAAAHFPTVLAVETVAGVENDVVTGVETDEVTDVENGVEIGAVTFGAREAVVSMTVCG